jgi:hypothetical protein
MYLPQLTEWEKDRSSTAQLKEEGLKYSYKIKLLRLNYNCLKLDKSKASRRVRQVSTALKKHYQQRTSTGLTTTGIIALPLTSTTTGIIQEGAEEAEEAKGGERAGTREGERESGSGSGREGVQREAARQTDVLGGTGGLGRVI